MAEPVQEIFEQFDKLYEFDREPVSADRLESGRHFAALFAGEHVAGTEFVIGALFVNLGFTARDVFLGLLLGNALAVLSWTLVCAPIAVETRLTLYWYLRRIAGPSITSFYNVLNAVLFCVLSGSMITVSASAVRIPFDIPAQTHWYPQDWRFVLVVVAVGAIVVCLAIAGFKRLAQFSSICSPWIFSVFFAGAVAMLPALTNRTGGQLSSLQDFWDLANTQIWTGVPPAGGQALGFWHVVAFAWICNLAMHIGLSDMALLRYAPNKWYGLYSACGMYLGHYMAWICAGVMGAATAVIVGRSLKSLDAGEVAFQSLGAAGAIAVVLAGWTTSNPTLYRAGLALQAVTPGWPRWVVTLLAGIGTTAIACFPFVFTLLLEFVAFYGILLMPVGTIVVVEHWLFPRLGLARYWSTEQGNVVNWPAVISWAAAIAASLWLYFGGLMHEFFLAIPIWFLTAALYVVLAALWGARRAPAQAPAGHAPPAPSRPAARAPMADDLRGTGARAAVLWVSGAVALASLAICIGLPIWLFRSPPDEYVARSSMFKLLLLWASIVHLASASVWIIEKEREGLEAPL